MRRGVHGNDTYRLEHNETERSIPALKTNYEHLPEIFEAALKKILLTAQKRNQNCSGITLERN